MPKIHFVKINLRIMIPLVLVLLLIVGFKKIKDFQDYDLTVIVESHGFADKENKDLFKGEKVIDQFKAKNNNLGIISVKFNTKGKINNDRLLFRIKEINKENWYYVNFYNVDQFQNDQYFPFGFPQIKDSKGKIYQIEIESSNGHEGDLVQLVKAYPFLSKYSFPLATFSHNATNLLVLLSDKVISFFTHIGLINYVIIPIVSVSFLYFLKKINLKKIICIHKFTFFSKMKFAKLIPYEQLNVIIKFIRKNIFSFSKLITIKQNNLFNILVISTFSAFLLYKIFYLFSEFIWSKNLNVDPDLLTSQVAGWVISPGQRDGIETYVLYLLILVCILLSIFLNSLFNFSLKMRKYKLVLFLSSLFILASYFYYSAIDFIPPMINRVVGKFPLLLETIIIAIIWIILKITDKKEKISNFLIIVLLIPICFIAISPFSTTDYEYIFAPALRLLNHFPIKDIYFQYDIFLSLIAALFMKFKIDLNLYQIIGQLSYYALFLGSFFFSKKLFLHKKLSYYLLAAVVLVKIYGLICDPILVFQVTPLRLDLWLPILVLSYFRGINSKSIGFSLGLMIIFHRAFGLIYSIGYLQAVSVLFLIEFWQNKKSLNILKEQIKKYFSLFWPNVLLLVFFFGLSLIIFSGSSLEAASVYQQIGIGFMQISTKSFYWYFPVLVSALMIALIDRKKILSTNYFNSSIFLIFLAIGNLIYFYGRSHENNLINIAASLLFILYLFFDLLLDFKKDIFKSKLFVKKILSTFVPIMPVVLIVFFYSSGIIDRSKTQFENLKKGQNIYPMKISENNLKIEKIREITNFSKKVYFAVNSDFYYYYYGDYVPQGHYSPHLSWVYKKDMLDYMQVLLNNGYYIVYSSGTSYTTLFANLIFDYSLDQDGFEVLWNED